MEGMSNIVDIQLHEFSDSSEKAYGGAVYLRLKDRIETNDRISFGDVED